MSFAELKIIHRLE